MAFPARHFQIERVVFLPRADVWALLAHNDRLNQVIGLPSVNFTPPAAEDTLLVREAQAKFKNFLPLRWKEFPFQWVKLEEYSVLRIYDKGPLARVWGGIRLAEAGPEATKLTIFADLTPANRLGEVLVPLLAKPMMEKTARYCEDAVAMRRAGKAPPLPVNRFRSPVDEGMLKPLRERLKRAPIRGELIEPLMEFLHEADDSEVAGLRPKKLARQWQTPLDDVLRLCLHATKVGLLNLGWHQMCPHCRVSKAEYSSLSQLTSQFDCDLCGVSYETNFDRFVELRFGVHPKIRAASAAIYCIGSPLVTPHILAQTSIESGGETSFFMPLSSDKLHLRVLRLNHILPIGSSYASTGPAIYTEEGWENTICNPAPDGALHIRNGSSHEIVLALEKEEWDDDAVTAAQVTTMREFRELFSSEVLAPGQSVGIESLTLFFSDLCDSTQLYENIGDAPAYGRVRRHFAWMFDIIGNHHGAIVKTIGDSVMAVFQSPEDALVSAVEVQKRVGEFNEMLDDEHKIAIKIGLHHGPAIAINSNDRLDYFGRTVNIAARIQSAAKARDIVFSDEVAERPGIQEIIKQADLSPETFCTNLKGIEGIFELQRIRI